MVAQPSHDRRAQVARGIHIHRLWRARPRLLGAAVVLLALGFTAELRGGAPKTADLPELASACRPFSAFAVGNTILVGADDPAAKSDAARSLHPLPADGPVLAYEEHSQFLYALGDASIAVRPSQPGEQRSGKPAFVRRFIHLKPGVFVVDDFVGPSVAGPLRWRLGLRSEPKAAGRQLRLTAGDQQLVCETLWPAAKALQSLAAVRDADESIHPFESVQESGAKGARWLHVFQLQPTSEGEATAACSLEDKDGEFALTITASQRVFRLTLPPPAAEAGWIAIEDASGKTLVPRRPFAAGVLPHGPEGTKLLERWDSAYRAGGQPGWDTGIVAPALKQAVESGAIKPCRTVDLGCGSGTNAIYLASQGFDVTGIDVAPTALGIAADKAAKAGVRVRWVLADVLALPELEPFDLVFDRGCYHNVRYVDAAGFVASLRQLTHPGTRCLILSCNRDGPPGVREHHMRSDFSALFDFEWLRDSGVESRDGTVRRESWSLMLRRKPE